MKSAVHLLRLVDATQTATESLKPHVIACLDAGETPSRISRTVHRNVDAIVTETIAAHQYRGDQNGQPQ